MAQDNLKSRDISCADKIKSKHIACGDNAKSNDIAHGTKRKSEESTWFHLNQKPKRMQNEKPWIHKFDLSKKNAMSLSCGQRDRANNLLKVMPKAVYLFCEAFASLALFYIDELAHELGRGCHHITSSHRNNHNNHCQKQQDRDLSGVEEFLPEELPRLVELMPRHEVMRVYIQLVTDHLQDEDRHICALTPFVDQDPFQALVQDIAFRQAITTMMKEELEKWEYHIDCTIDGEVEEDVVIKQKNGKSYTRIRFYKYDDIY